MSLYTSRSAEQLCCSELGSPGVSRVSAVSYGLVRCLYCSELSSVMCPQAQLGQLLIELCAAKSLIYQQVRLDAGRGPLRREAWNQKKAPSSAFCGPTQVRSRAWEEPQSPVTEGRSWFIIGLSEFRGREVGFSEKVLPCL